MEELRPEGPVGELRYEASQHGTRTIRGAPEAGSRLVGHAGGSGLHQSDADARANGSLNPAARGHTLPDPCAEPDSPGRTDARAGVHAARGSLAISPQATRTSTGQYGQARLTMYAVTLLRA